MKCLRSALLLSRDNGSNDLSTLSRREKFENSHRNPLKTTTWDNEQEIFEFNSILSHLKRINHILSIKNLITKIIFTRHVENMENWFLPKGKVGRKIFYDSRSDFSTQSIQKNEQFVLNTIILNSPCTHV